MKIKNLKLILCILGGGFAGFSQSNFYYYYKGQKIDLILDKTLVKINASENLNKTTVTDLDFKDFNFELSSENQQNQKIAKLEFQNVPTDSEFLEKFNTLKQDINVNNVFLYFKRLGAPSIGISDYFYVKLKNENNFETLQQVALQKNVQIVKQVPFMPKWYILRLKRETNGNTLDLSNYFYETGLFADVDPAFMFDFRLYDDFDANSNNLVNNAEISCTNDPAFMLQWGMKNEINPNVDINVCEAWSISEGLNTKVAVVDAGMYPHLDLNANYEGAGFNSSTGTIGSTPGTSAHGNMVAGVIAAIKNNNYACSGVAPKSKILRVSNAFPNSPIISAQLASGISWAVANNADVINNCWGDQGGTYPNYAASPIYSSLLESAIIDAMENGRSGKGCLVVFASGNRGAIMDYPGNFDERILCVGGIDINGNRFFQNYGYQSAYGSMLDLVAPGKDITSTFPVNGDGTFGPTYTQTGTSFAAPHVSGVCALILSINPCLNGQQVRDIIEQTSQKVGSYSYTVTPNKPNGTWNNEMGYGLLDAYAALQMAQAIGLANLDLMVKDGVDDVGLEPNNITPYMWTSSDIWIRNQPDGIEIQEFQNPEYSPNIPSYAYVRVTNRSCFTSTGTEELKFYWAKAGTSLEWPDTWDGEHYFPAPNDGKKLGAPVGNITIPPLQAGEETILEIPFMLPNPDDYAFAGSDQWHFCLLARIESSNDISNETDDLYSNVQNNNNIAWKNVTIVDLVADRPSGVIAVGNPFNEPRTFVIELVKENLEIGKPIYDEAEVSVEMDSVLLNAWEAGGKQAQQLKSTFNESQKVVTGNNVLIDNIAFKANEMGFLSLSFNFLTEALTEKSKYVYHVLQKDKITGKIIGGETYIIKKEVRPVFFADTGGIKYVNQNEPITISANQISEPAIYNWYDINGNLVYTGKDLTIAVEVATKYKLEVIANADGFKDYSEVDVKLKPSNLETITPNPGSSMVRITYKLNEVVSAYLMIFGGYGTTGVSNNYLLGSDSSFYDIDVSSYSSGFYTVALVCNGEIVDAKTLIKQ